VPAGREPIEPCSCTADCDFDVDECVDAHQSEDAAAAAADDDDDDRRPIASLFTPNPVHVIHQHFTSLYQQPRSIQPGHPFVGRRNSTGAS